MILGFVSHAVAIYFCSVLRKIKTLSLVSVIVTNLKTFVDQDSSLFLKPSEHLKHLVNQFNNMSSQPDYINSDDPENTVSSKYYDIDELQNLKINNSNSLSLFHINACSLSRNFDDLQHLLSCTNKNFDIIAITETRITKNVSIKNTKHFLLNYSTEFTLTESSAGCILQITFHTCLIKT